MRDKSSLRVSRDTCPREIWVDNVKVVACVFVVLGHFVQSMGKSGLIIRGDTYYWFYYAVSSFHVPLFFICSGYLYQRFSHVNSFSTWIENMRKKLVALGVPYFFFSTVTVVLVGAAGSAANGTSGSLLTTLLFEPRAPYWYLYVLFFIFAVTPTVDNGKQASVILAIALGVKVLQSANTECGWVPLPYLVDKLCNFEVWFAGGMLLARWRHVCIPMWVSVVLLVAFIPLSVTLCSLFGMSGDFAQFLLGLIACIGVIGVIKCTFTDNKQRRPFLWLAPYIMPIFLMHTICAAGIRIFLFKFGVTTLSMHVVLGVGASFVGPVVIAKVMEHVDHLDFLVYPRRYIR